MDIEILVFWVEVFQFSKFRENGAKHNKRNVNKGLAVTFMLINS